MTGVLYSVMVNDEQEEAKLVIIYFQNASH